MDDAEKIVIGVLVVVGTVMAGVVGAFALALWSAYALTYLWAWFVVPLFALPALSVPQAYGLMLVTGLFKSHRKSPDKIWEIYFIGALGPLAALGVGYILKGYL